MRNNRNGKRKGRRGRRGGGKMLKMIDDNTVQDVVLRTRRNNIE
jgi:hypothetical protein